MKYFAELAKFCSEHTDKKVIHARKAAKGKNLTKVPPQNQPKLNEFLQANTSHGEKPMTRSCSQITKNVPIQSQKCESENDCIDLTKDMKLDGKL